MIYGIGTDIIQIGRVEAALKRNGERFAEKILGPEELEKYRRVSPQKKPFQKRLVWACTCR
jgi:holo-[acyl-carrier-protein] synthase